MRKSEPQTEETGAQPLPIGTPKSGKALSKLKRELTEDEIRQPGVQKMILEELEHAEQEIKELRDFRDKYYVTDKKVAVLESSRKLSITWEVLSSGCMSIGSVAIGFAPSIWKIQPTGSQILTLGIITFIIGIIARCIRL